MEDSLVARRNDMAVVAATPAPVAACSARVHVLVIEDEPEVSEALCCMLHEQRCEVSSCSGMAEAIGILQRGPRPDIAFIDSHLHDKNGSTALAWFCEVAPRVPVVAISCSEDPRCVIEALRSGATDAVIQPFDAMELRFILQRYLKPRPTGGVGGFQEITLSPSTSFVFCSERMQELAAQCAMVAKFDLPILLLGESGTGKEILAHYIHQVSDCADQTFLKVNCAAMPADLLESELLGYEQGAFTGATKSKPGKFELCDHGTIFLDEIGEMPAGLQAKLLQVLQDGTFSRLGGRTTIKVNVRVIAATNINIKSAIAQRRFREDLYYRLNGFSLTVPPLRERREEIPVLIRHFITRLGEKYARRPVTISEDLLAACMQCPWPGNIRELENFVKRFLVLGDERLMMKELTPIEGARVELAGDVTMEAHPGGLKHLVRNLKGKAEAEIIAQTLRRNQWKHKQTAAELKISYKALLYKIRQYRIEEPRAAVLF